MKGLRICATGSAVPARIMTNEELSGIVDTSDEWIRRRTGMKERHYLSEGENLTQFAAKAAEEALERSGLHREEIGVVLVATMSADYFCPSTACLLQKDLGLSRDLIALDLNAACSGFVFGLETMRGLLLSTGKKGGILVGAECLSRKLNMEDRGSCVLFGDGAAAAVLTLSDGPYTSVTGVMGDRDLIACPVEGGLIRMDGRSTYLFAVETIPLVMKEAAEKAGLSLDEIGHFILHQANLRILESIASKLHQPIEKFPVNIGKYGNTSGASVALALHEAAAEGILCRGEKIMLCAFGAGRTWGAVVMEW